MNLRSFPYHFWLSLIFFQMGFWYSAYSQRNLELDFSECRNFEVFSLEKIEWPEDSVPFEIENLEIDENGLLWVFGKETFLYDGLQFFPLPKTFNDDLKENPLVEIRSEPSVFLDNGILYWENKGKIIRKFKTNLSSRLELLQDYHSEKEIYLYHGRTIYALLGLPNGDIQLHCLVKNIKLQNVSALERDEKTGVFILGTSSGEIYKLHPKYFSNWYQKGEANAVNNNIYSIVDVGRDSLLSGSGILYRPDTSYRIATPMNSPTKDLKNRIWAYRNFDGGQQHGGYTERFYLEIDKNFKQTLVPHNTEIPFGGKGVIDSNGGVWFINVTGKSLGLRYHSGIDDPKMEVVEIHDSIRLVEYIYYNRFNHSLLLGEWGDTSLNFFSLDINSYLNGGTDYLQVVDGFILSFSYLLRDIQVDKDGHFWAALRGHGYHSVIQDSLYALPMDRRDLLKYPHRILQDEKDFFWISTNDGIIQAYRPELMAWLRGETEEVYYHHYGYENGIESRELNGWSSQSGVICANGKFAFCSIRGPVVFDPDEIPQVETANQILLRGLKVDGLAIDYRSDLEIDYNSGVLEFLFSVPFLGTYSNRPVIEYQLNGSNRPWQKLEEDGRLVLNSLPEGKYQLRLRLKNGFGINNYLEREVEFRVAGTWYTSSWFSYGIIIILLLLVIAGLWFRSVLAKRSQLEMENEVQRQTQSQRNLNDELSYKNAQLSKIQKQNTKLLKSRDRLIGLYIHDIRGPLNFIQSISKDTNAYLAELDKGAFQKRIEMLREAAKGIFSQSERMFKWISAESMALQYSPKKIALEELVKECISKYDELATQKGVQIKVE